MVEVTPETQKLRDKILGVLEDYRNGLFDIESAVDKLLLIIREYMEEILELYYYDARYDDFDDEFWESDELE